MSRRPAQSLARRSVCPYDFLQLNKCVQLMNAAKAQLDLIPTRRSLLSRLRDLGDQESWSDFFRSYWRLIYEVALKAGLTDAEAQEVVQETVISVAKQMPGFRYDAARGKFKGWLLQI